MKKKKKNITKEKNRGIRDQLNTVVIKFNLLQPFTDISHNLIILYPLVAMEAHSTHKGNY